MFTDRLIESTIPYVRPVVRPRLRTAAPSDAVAVPVIVPMSTISQAVPRDAEMSATAQSTDPPSDCLASVPTTLVGHVPPSTPPGCACVSPVWNVLSMHITWKLLSIIGLPETLSRTIEPSVPTYTNPPTARHGPM